MNTELQPVLDLLTGKLHWLPALLVWVGALKTLFHFAGQFLTRWTAGILVRMVNSPDPEDDHFLLAILDNRFYQLLHFVLALFSLPLPARSDYDAALASAIPATPAKPATPPPGSVGVIALLITLSVALGITGCTNPGAQAFATEQLTADTAASATSSFNAYYHSATNTADAASLAQLDSARSQLYDADRSLAATLTLVENLRQAHATNSATTNQAALTLALAAVQSQSSNIVALVQLFLNPPQSTNEDGGLKVEDGPAAAAAAGGDGQSTNQSP